MDFICCKILFLSTFRLQKTPQTTILTPKGRTIIFLVVVVVVVVVGQAFVSNLFWFIALANNLLRCLRLCKNNLFHNVSVLPPKK